MIYKQKVISFLTLVLVIFIIACDENNNIEYISREDTIHEDAVKITPETDLFPPIMHSYDWYDPIPLIGSVNTAGGEDSPFIPVGQNKLFFFFTPDVSTAAENQLIDGTTGIYQADLISSESSNVNRIVLQDSDKLALDGCPFVLADTIWFCSAREGYSGLHWFRAQYKNGVWTNWENADFRSDYGVGEFHMHEDMLYYHSSRSGGQGNFDIWKSKLIANEWSNPVNINSINTQEMDGYPFITADGNELWFTRNYLGSPAIFCSKKDGDSWNQAELIISQFAGEPTLDSEGNIYFVHHFYHDGKMIESDIYVAKKK